jgi:hypothetical protein
MAGQRTRFFGWCEPSGMVSVKESRAAPGPKRRHEPGEAEIVLLSTIVLHDQDDPTNRDFLRKAADQVDGRSGGMNPGTGDLLHASS